MNQQISARILALVAQGMDVMSALKQVCGAAHVDAMIDTLYTELRARANKGQRPMIEA